METWSYTNENLEAITQSLNIQPDDKVLAVCSIGAQFLALLEFLKGSGLLVAVDYNPQQLDLAKTIVDIAVRRDARALARLDICPRNQGYFNRRRLKRIAMNMPKVRFMQNDLRERLEIKERFTKVYLSNVLANLNALAEVVEKGSLIYLAYKNHRGTKITSKKGIENFIQYYYGNRFADLALSDFYAIDVERTFKAIQLESKKPLTEGGFFNPMHVPWCPLIYRRI